MIAGVNVIDILIGLVIIALMAMICFSIIKAVIKVFILGLEIIAAAGLFGVIAYAPFGWIVSTLLLLIIAAAVAILIKNKFYEYRMRYNHGN